MNKFTIDKDSAEKILGKQPQPDQSSRLLTDYEIIKAKELALSGKVTYSGEMAIAKAQLAKDDAKIEELERALIDANFRVHTKKSDSDTRIEALIEALKIKASRLTGLLEQREYGQRIIWECINELKATNKDGKEE